MNSIALLHSASLLNADDEVVNGTNITSDYTTTAAPLTTTAAWYYPPEVTTAIADIFNASGNVTQQEKKDKKTGVSISLLSFYLKM